MLKELNFNGEVVVITGGGQGIGRACAEAVGELGAAVVIAEHDGAQLKQAEAALKAQGVECLAVEIDVTNEADVAKLAAAVEQRWGGSKPSSTMRATTSGRRWPSCQPRSGARS